MTENHAAPAGLLLSMQILYEKLKEHEISVSLLPPSEEPCLTGVQFYTGQQDLSRAFLYLADPETLSSHPFPLSDGFLVSEQSTCSGKCPELLFLSHIPGNDVSAGSIQCPATDFYRILSP